MCGGTRLKINVPFKKKKKRLKINVIFCQSFIITVEVLGLVYNVCGAHVFAYLLYKVDERINIQLDNPTSHHFDQYMGPQLFRFTRSNS